MKIPFETALYGTLRHLPAKSRIPYLLVIFLLNIFVGWSQVVTNPSYPHDDEINIDEIGISLTDLGDLESKANRLVLSTDFNSKGEKFILTFGNGVQKVINDNQTQVIIPGSQLYSPLDFAIDSQDRFFVTNVASNNRKILVFDSGGTPLPGETIGNGDYGVGPENFKGPTGIAFDDDDNLYIADHYSGDNPKASERGHIKVFFKNGAFTEFHKVNGDSLNYPYRIAANSDGRIFLAEVGPRNGWVQVIDLDEQLKPLRIDSLEGPSNHLGSPGDLIVDNEDLLYVADFGEKVSLETILEARNDPMQLIGAIGEIQEGIENEVFKIRVYDKTLSYKGYILDEVDLPVDLAFGSCGKLGVNNLNITGGLFTGYTFDFDLEIYTRTPYLDTEDPVAYCIPKGKEFTLQNGKVTLTGDMIDDGSIDNCGIKSYSLSQYEFTTAGTYPVTLTVTDEAGNTHSCETEIIILEEVAPDPIVTCPENSELPSLPLDLECSYELPNWEGLIGTENFNSLSFEVVSEVQQDFKLAVKVNVLESDVIVETCELEFTLTDNIEPQIDCPPNIAKKIPSGTSTIKVIYDEPAVSDNCSASLLRLSGPASGDELSEGNYEVVYQVEDTAGNTAECSFDIIVTREQAKPEVECPVNSELPELELDANCEYSLPDFEALITTSNFNDLNFEISSETREGKTLLVSVDILEGQDFVDTCELEFSLIDVTPPEILCPDDIIKEIPSDQSTIVVNYNEPQVFDNCEGELKVTLIDGPISGSTLEEGEYIVEYMVTDEAGQEATCEFEIIITKQEPSDFEIACSNHELVLDTNGKVTLDPEILYAGQESNLSFEASQTEFNCSDLGVNQITLTATDPDTGETATCSAEIFIFNEIEPQAACVPSGTEFRMVNGELNLTPADINDGSSAVCELKMELSQTSFTTPGNKTITLTVFDKSGATDSCTTTISVVEEDENPLNSPPVANDDTYSVDQDDILNVIAPGVLDNDTDAENDALTAVVQDSPQNGTLSLSSDGSFTYEPNAGYSGPDSFTYIANDGSDDSNVATVSITVNAFTPGNTAPIANDDNYAVDQDDVLIVIAPGVLENDTDAEDDALTAIVEESPQNGTLSLNSDGSFTYEPNAGYSGPDSFTYIANDDSDDSNVATVRINVESLSEDFQCIETPINLQLNQSGSANVTLNDLYSGDATGLNLVASQLEFNCEDIGENVIELSWTGERSGSCEITVVVEDNLQPTAKVSFISVTLDENGIAEIEPEDLDNGSSDNCGEVIFSVSKSRFTCEDTGQNTVSLTLTDPSGNSTSLNTIVFVNANPGTCTEPPRDKDYVFLYPNPTDGLVKISTPRDITVEQVFVFDKRGRFILSKAFDKSDQEYELQIDGVQNAVYTLRIITNEDEIIRRLIIRN